MDVDFLNTNFTKSNQRAQVVDANPQAKTRQFEDVSAVQKFELTQEEYESRTDTVRAFKERNKLGRFNKVGR